MAKNTNEKPVTIVTPRGNPRQEIRDDNRMSGTNLADPEGWPSGDSDALNSPF
jgi:hypothetical protein